MLEGTDIEITAQLPDENEYPAPLLARCELLECFSEQDDTRTLLAKDRESDRLYVVKCHLATGPFYDRAEPEALRKLSEDPFPRFVAEYRNEYMRCVLREYVEGETLEELAKHTHFSEEDVIRTGMQLCDELKILHSLTPPVIHRDIKPQNVIIRPDGCAVLIDFGISRVITDRDTDMDTVPFGTQGFAPPEQYGFAQTDARSDLYSLGILLSWMLTGLSKKLLSGALHLIPENGMRVQPSSKKHSDRNSPADAEVKASCGGCWQQGSYAPLLSVRCFSRR